jgi:hypothetical protein
MPLHTAAAAKKQAPTGRWRPASRAALKDRGHHPYETPACAVMSPPDAANIDAEFDALGRMLRGLVDDLSPVDRHFETLREIETRFRELGCNTVQALEDAEDEIFDLLDDEVIGGAP